MRFFVKHLTNNPALEFVIHHHCPFIRVVHLHFCKISSFVDPQDYAGTRSDFVVVGHPEYNLGKAMWQRWGKYLEN